MKKATNILFASVFCSLILATSCSWHSDHSSLSTNRLPSSITPEECISNLNGDDPTVTMNMESLLPPINNQDQNGTCFAQTAVTILTALKLKTLGAMPSREAAFAQADYSPELALMLLALRDENFLNQRMSNMKESKSGEVFGGGWSSDVLTAIKGHPEVLVPISSNMTYKAGFFRKDLRNELSSIFWGLNHMSNSSGADKITKQIKNGLATIMKKIEKSSGTPAQAALKALTDAGISRSGDTITIGPAQVNKGINFVVKTAGTRYAHSTSYNQCQQALDLVFYGICHRIPVEMSIFDPRGPEGYHSVTAVGLTYVGQHVPTLIFRDTAGSETSGELLTVPVADLCNKIDDQRGPYRLYSASTAELAH